MTQTLNYRLSVGLVIINSRGLVFVGKRADMAREKDDIAWQMPQGGIDPNESLIDAAFREMVEEIGTKNCTVLATSQSWVHYDFPEELAMRLWEGKYKGQKQKWMLFRFEGEDEEINIDTSHPEFCKWRWMTPEALLDIIVSFKKKTYTKIFEEFKDYF